jgi:hypothetical protein
MRVAIPPLPQFAFIVWCSVKKGRGTNLSSPLRRYIIIIIIIIIILHPH